MSCLLQVLNLVVFGIFNIVFWGVALSHYNAEYDSGLTLPEISTLSYF